MKVHKLFSVLFAVASAQAACVNFSKTKNCPRDTPCCNNGWCSNDPKFCATGCEPENSYSEKSCYPQPGCVSLDEQFENSDALINLQDKEWDGNPNKHSWTSDFQPDNAQINDGMLEVSMRYDGTKKNELGNYAGFGSRVSWTRFMMYGKVTARIKTGSCGLGVVSSFIVKNDPGDEVDFEWVGLNPNEAQSNYYWWGVLDWTHGEHHDVGANTCEDFHEYGVEWGPDQTTWSIDGKVVRTLNKEDARADNGTYMYPFRPMRVQFSIWDGGALAKGTADWAGTPTDWSDPNRVYTMFVDWIKVECAQEDDATQTWPPEGYGPPKATKGSYETFGEGDPSINGGSGGADGGDGNQIPPDESSVLGDAGAHLLVGFTIPALATILSMLFIRREHM
jgi:beta-glucanase (GH16 family)